MGSERHESNLNTHFFRLQVMDDDEHYVDDPNNPQYQHFGGEYAYQAGHSGEDFEGDGFQAEHAGYEASGDLTLLCYGLI